MTAKELAILAAKALDGKKGEEIRVMEVTELTVLADYFVICTGSSNIIALVPSSIKIMSLS